MAEKPFIDKLVSAWHNHLESDEYDEDVSTTLLGAIEDESPVEYKKIVDKYGM